MTADALTLLQNHLARDLRAFLPELILCGAIVAMLLIRLIPRFDSKHLGWVALVLTVYALIVSIFQWSPMPKGSGLEDYFDYDPRADLTTLPIFSGMLVYDNLTIFLRLFLLSFTALVIFLTLMTRVPDREDSADFYCLLLGSVVGMSVMGSSNHLLMVLLGIEMASLPSYAMAGFLKGRRQSSEAALKYVVYGGGAAGIMLYGISLLAGKFGTAFIPDLANFMSHNPLDPVVLLGSLFILVGIAFKLAAVPFHFWCPDVFEGAAAEVGAFLSVASKGAALVLLGRLVLNLAGLTYNTDPNVWYIVARYLIPTIAFLAAVTTTFGNLAAYGQTNLKRLLAYSTIAHAGFMMMGLAVMSREGVGAVLFYLIVYMFMNLGAFAVVAILRNLTGSEDLADFRGLIHRNPLLVVTLAIFLLSLLGLPPLGGFVAKFQIFSVVFNGARELASRQFTGLSLTLYALLVVAALNTVLSLFYYLKVLKVMVLDPPLEVVEGRPVEQLPTPSVANIYITVVAAIVLVLGVYLDPLSQATREDATSTFTPVPSTAPAKMGNRIPGAP